MAAGIATAHTAYNLTRLRVPVTSSTPVSERVSVLIPARDEARQIGACLSAVLASESVPHLEVLVMDDGSVDGTAEVARAVAGTDTRVRVLDGGADPLPPGWLGKPFACARLARAATGEVLVFLDADVVLASNGLAATVRLLRDSGLRLVCPYPRQLADGVLPRLVQPLLQWSWLTFLPLAASERSTRPSLSAANGQLLACDAGTYRATGGHGAVHDNVLDDIGLLKSFKRKGFHGAVADGTELATCRMYTTSAELADGYRKSLWAAFGSPGGAVVAAAALLGVYVAPPLLAVTGPGVAVRAMGVAGYTAGVAGRALVARRTGQRLLPDVLVHPASVLALAVLLASSWRGHNKGSLTWRGRPLPGRARG